MNATGRLTLHAALNLTSLINESSIHIYSSNKALDGFYAAVPYLLSVLCVAITCSNALVLSAFVVNKHLRTPFNMYLINLLISDLAQSLLDSPFTIMAGFVPFWPLGRQACNFNLYGKWVYTAVVRNTHSLISLNRIWALFFPIHYKQYHTKITAIWLCVGTWIYVHIWLLPGIIPDDLYYRLDDGSCLINTTANPNWALPTQVVLYNSSVFVVALSYPAIWWKVRQRRKTTPTTRGHQLALHRRNTNRSSITPTAGLGPGTCVSVGGSSNHNATSGKTDKDTAAGSGSAEAAVQGTGHAEDYSAASGTRGISTGQRRAQIRRRVAVSRSESFAVLTYLVVGVVFCWTPIMVYFTMAIVDTNYDSYLHFIIGSLLYFLNSFLDPIFFTMAITPLRETVYRILDRFIPGPLRCC